MDEFKTGLGGKWKYLLEKQGCFFSYFLPGSKRLQPSAVGGKSENTIPKVLDNIKRLIGARIFFRFYGSCTFHFISQYEEKKAELHVAGLKV